MRINIIFLQGGLGNQMFQYAFYLSIKHIFNHSLYNTGWFSFNSCHQGFELNNLFGIQCNSNKLFYIILRIARKLDKFVKIPGLQLIQDKIPSTYIQCFPLSSLNLFDGYWQTEKYFNSIDKEIREAFTFDFEKISVKSLEVLNSIRISSNPISIHIRRGDYLSEDSKPLYGGICTLKYYEEAINLILQKFDNCDFFIFSDDIQWAKDNLSIPDAVFVNHNVGKDSWQDMFLMSQCKHNIIANSSFSWWGAWLNDNPEKIVIAPRKFMNVGNSSDIIPSTWIKI